MATQPDQKPTNMIARIKGILLQPKAEWQAIDAEPATTNSILMGWVVPLAAIRPIAMFIGMMVFGYNFLLVHIRPSIGWALTNAILSFISAIVGVWLLALIIDALAPSFGGTKNPVQAMKVSAYSATASFVAGIFWIVPTLGMIGALLGLYSLYLLYVGLPVLMKSPPEKALGYTIVTILVAIVVFVVLGMIVGAITSAFFSPLGGYGSPVTIG